MNTMYMTHPRPNPIPPPPPPLSMDRITNSNNAFPQSTPSGGVTPGSAKAEGPKSTETTYRGWKWRLDVVQQPIRARMCGFGDKDRRPITPPPCVRLIVTDCKTGKEVDVNEIDMTYFVLTVDLWDESGTKEVNLVKHSATSPSISTATQTSYPPAPSQMGPIQDPNWNPMLDTRTHPQAQQMRQNYFTSLHNNGQPSPYQAQPPPAAYGYPQNPQYPTTGYGQSQAYNAPSVYGQSPQYPPASHFGYSHHPQQHNPISHTPTSQYSSGGPPLTPTSAALPPAIGASQPAMFTRNLIGSLSASAFRLTDTEEKPGIWFILQDLSVRTEGTFRLKMNFVNVGTFEQSAMTLQTTVSINGNTTSSDPSAPVLTNSTAPVLASCFSEPFQVFSAKKFPGVIESTKLSRCFAIQGIKIPIRKDGKGNGPRGSISGDRDADVDPDDAYD